MTKPSLRNRECVIHSYTVTWKKTHSRYSNRVDHVTVGFVVIWLHLRWLLASTEERRVISQIQIIFFDFILSIFHIYIYIYLFSYIYLVRWKSIWFFPDYKAYSSYGHPWDENSVAAIMQRTKVRLLSLTFFWWDLSGSLHWVTWNLEIKLIWRLILTVHSHIFKEVQSQEARPGHN